jgi:hypothetical protein
MNGVFWAIGAAMVVVAGGMSYAVTRRYGWVAAVSLPLAALAAMVGMSWQDQGLDFAGGIDFLQEAVIFAAPILVGAAVGIALALRRRA